MKKTARIVALMFGLMLLPQAPGVAASLPGTKGIALTVTLARTEIQPGQDLVYTVTLRNVSGADIQLYRTNQDDLRLVDITTGTVWVTQASQLPPPAAPPAVSTFKAGEEWIHTVRLGPRTKFGHAGSKPEVASGSLPVGRYRFEYSTTFVDHYPDRKDPVWTGTLRAEPLALEIGGKKP